MVALMQIDEDAVRAVEDLALSNGVLKIMPTAFYRQFSQEVLFGFCARNGIYGLPTIELLDKLNALIMEASPSRLAIEIGSGSGVLGKGLGIQCTDNHMQNDPSVQALYSAVYGHAVVKYGDHVAVIGGNEAVDHYRPEVVVASWVTHKYSVHEHHRGGNMYGVDEALLLSKIKRYVFVGNLKTHENKPLLQVPHTIIRGDYILSKSMTPDQNVIIVWDR
jgi:hypothetical protein